MLDNNRRYLGTICIVMKLNFFSTRIHQASDSLSVALLKKADNHSFSRETSEKLICVASRDIKLSSAVGESVFLNKAPAEGAVIDKEAINKLRIVLTDCLINVNNEDARRQFNAWLANCAKALPVEWDQGSGAREQQCIRNKEGIDRLHQLRNDYGEPVFLAKGSNGHVLKLGDYVIKRFKQFNEGAVLHELSMCNSYNASVGGGRDSAYLVKKELLMPYVEGRVPTMNEVIEGVKSLYEQGYMMGDPCPRNFRVTSEGIVPIDFGQMFNVDEYESLDERIKFSIVHDYMKGGSGYVRDGIRAEYNKVLMAMDQSLGRSSPSRLATTLELKALGYFGNRF
ncbi:MULTISPECIES: hypothetical protein [Pseudomonas]|uniref:hypothetical protein n=1 Tax=Pseudomonas TaxID=286 RepID=UPI00117A365E|nr:MULTISPECIES: hypothetical protein [Pseudomonas]